MIITYTFHVCGHTITFQLKVTRNNKSRHSTK